ncbi:MAG TPA: hypothetical protein VFV03_00740 [Solirubrobacteraceae bacterium]|nr:hypothetical protein [Solirubrobacteraceae bacterium]
MGPLQPIAPLLLAAAFAPASAQSLLHSRELWATVDVCSPKDQPNTIGIRGSMPGDGHPKDVMYMRFRVQYLNAATKKWLNLSQGADSGFLRVGSAQLARQAGRSFQLAPVAGKPVFTLRGSVVFQWRRGMTVLETATKPTASGHTSLAGADPRGFSAATCKLG